MRADWQGVKKFQSGDILNRLNGDTQTAASIAISWIPSVIVTGFSFASSFVTILFYNVPMAFIALLSAPFLVVVSRGLMKKSRLFHRLVLEKESALMSFETETFCNYDTVKSLGAAEAYGDSDASRRSAKRQALTTTFSLSAQTSCSPFHHISFRLQPSDTV